MEEGEGGGLDPEGRCWPSCHPCAPLQHLECCSWDFPPFPSGPAAGPSVSAAARAGGLQWAPGCACPLNPSAHPWGPPACPHGPGVSLSPLYVPSAITQSLSLCPHSCPGVSPAHVPIALCLSLHPLALGWGGTKVTPPKAGSDGGRTGRYPRGLGPPGGPSAAHPTPRGRGTSHTPQSQQLGPAGTRSGGVPGVLGLGGPALVGVIQSWMDPCPHPQGHTEILAVSRGSSAPGVGGWGAADEGEGPQTLSWGLSIPVLAQHPVPSQGSPPAW